MGVVVVTAGLPFPKSHDQLTPPGEIAEKSTACARQLILLVLVKLTGAAGKTKMGLAERINTNAKLILILTVNNPAVLKDFNRISVIGSCAISKCPETTIRCRR